MTRYLLDTNVCIDYLRRADSKVREKLATLPVADVYLCSVVLGELVFGAHRSNSPDRNLALIEDLTQTIVSLPFDDTAAATLGLLRAHLTTSGQVIGPYDLQIAAIALTYDLTLVTHNVKEFSRVPKLQIDDWIAGS